jgi:glycosyltransferase involved in cell wall biosynthesis
MTPSPRSDARGYEPVQLSLVLACYNEEQLIDESVEQILEVLDCCRWTYEVIFVDDCSRDGTRESIARIVERFPGHALRVVFHDRNVGRGGTVTEGIRLARGAIVGFIDIDLEVHARYIPSCVRAIQRGADVASGLRTYKFYWHSLDRYLMSRGYIRLVQWLLDVPLRDTETGFKFFRKERVLSVLDEIEDRHWFWDTEVMVRCFLRGLNIREIPVLFLRRFDKQSGVRAIKDTVDYFRKLWKFRRVVRKLRQEAGLASISRGWVQESL